MLSPSKSWAPGSQIVESVVQDIAKNVIDRSQRWGVNRANREPTIESRRSSTAYQKVPPSQSVVKEIAADQDEVVRQNALLIKRIVAGEDRQRQLARILETGINGMKLGQTEEAEKRLVHVKECLLDGGKVLQKEYLQKLVPASLELTADTTADKLDPSSASTPRENTSSRPKVLHRRIPSSPGASFVKASFKNNSDTDFLTRSERPRTTLAQSSFAWMLGDDPAEKNRTEFVPKGRNEEDTGKSVVEGPEEVDLGPL